MTFQLSENAEPNWVIVSRETFLSDARFIVCSSYEIGQERLVVEPKDLVTTMSEIFTRRFDLPTTEESTKSESSSDNQSQPSASKPANSSDRAPLQRKNPAKRKRIAARG